MLRKSVLAIFLTLIPLFTAVTTTKAATFYTIFDFFKFFTVSYPTRPPASTNPTQTPTVTPSSAPSPPPTITPIPTATPSLTPTLTPSPTSAPASSSGSIKSYIMNEINTYRKSVGLTEVKTDGFTCGFAKIRTSEISSNFNHNGFTDRMNSKSLPYPTFSKVTENIAMTSSYTKVVTNWKNSSGHAANMRADTPYVCVEKSGNYYAYEGWKP